MKKCVIYIDDITTSGGTERVASFLANNLVAVNRQVVLISRTNQNYQPYYALDSRVCYKAIGSRSLRKLFLSLVENPCDVIISISMGRLSFILSHLHAILRLRSRLVLSEHVPYESSPCWIRVMKWLSYQLADDLILLTKHDYKLLHHRVRAHARVIGNASAFSSINESVCDRKQKIVLAVGRLTYEKAFQRLICIWASIEDLDSWSLRIVGDGKDRAMLQQLIDTLGVTDSVTLVPALKSIDKEYAKASILAMSSRYEGLPLVLIEAKSFALPAISFDCKTGPREVIEDGVDGFLIPEGDEQSYRTQLLNLMRDSELRNKMQLAALSNSSKYSADAIFKQWLEFI
jgi:Glycosyltransferase